jgi:hypothetical protein
MILTAVRLRRGCFQRASRPNFFPQPATGPSSSISSQQHRAPHRRLAAGGWRSSSISSQVSGSPAPEGVGERRFGRGAGARDLCSGRWRILEIGDLEQLGATAGETSLAGEGGCHRGGRSPGGTSPGKVDIGETTSVDRIGRRAAGKDRGRRRAARASGGGRRRGIPMISSSEGDARPSVVRSAGSRRRLPREPREELSREQLF